MRSCAAGRWRTRDRRRKGSSRYTRALWLGVPREQSYVRPYLSRAARGSPWNDGAARGRTDGSAETLTLVDITGQRWYEAELYRLQGALLLQRSSDNHTEAETCFHHALEIARTQQAKSFELRAATSLARLWQQQGKRQEAHDLLAPVYGWFTEGFDTADLKDAKALLDELA